MNKKWPLIILGLIAIAVITAIVFSLFLFNPTTDKTKNVQSSIPTNPPPTVSKSQAAQQLLKSIVNRQSLSSTDEQIRQHLIANITPDNDIVYQTNEFVIEYVQGPNDFETTILNTNINVVKQDVVSWFKSQGISDQGVCNLPLNFTVSPSVARQLPARVSFSRLPDDC